MHVMHASAPVHQRPPLGAPVHHVHDMHGPNSLDNTPSATPGAPAQVAIVGHKSIFRETSSASSLSDQRRHNISNTFSQ